MSECELEAAGLTIWHHCSLDARKNLHKFLGFPKDHYTSHAKILTSIKGITSLGINQALRIMIVDKLIDASNSAGGDSTAITAIANQYYSSKVSAFTSEQAAIAERRADRVSKKIAQLNAQKKDLAPKPVNKP